MVIDLKRSIDLRWLFDPMLLFILRWSCFSLRRGTYVLLFCFLGEPGEGGHKKLHHQHKEAWQVRKTLKKVVRLMNFQILKWNGTLICILWNDLYFLQRILSPSGFRIDNLYVNSSWSFGGCITLFVWACVIGLPFVAVFQKKTSDW